MSRASKPVLALFVRNERKGCEASVPAIDRTLFAQTFAIDAGSTDGSPEFLKSIGITVFSQVSSGYSGAYEDAAAVANGKPLCVFHPKGTVNAEVLKRMVIELDLGADLVIASRMVAGGKNADDDSWLRHRKWFGRFAGLVLYFRYGRGSRMPVVADPLHGVRGFSARFLEGFSLSEGSVAADLEIIQSAYQRGMTIVEVPVVEAERLSGKTNFPTVRTGMALVAFLCKKRVG